jgi:hypothetical protein
VEVTQALSDWVCGLELALSDAFDDDEDNSNLLRLIRTPHEHGSSLAMVVLPSPGVDNDAIRRQSVWAARIAPKELMKSFYFAADVRCVIRPRVFAVVGRGYGLRLIATQTDVKVNAFSDDLLEEKMWPLAVRDRINAASEARGGERFCDDQPLLPEYLLIACRAEQQRQRQMDDFFAELERQVSQEPVD